VGGKFVWVGVFLSLLVASGFAQEMGRLRGTVKNAKGEPIALEVVTATHLATGKVMRALTQKDGTYLFPSLTPGIWRLEVNVRDYFRAKRDGVLIVAGKEAVVDFVLYPLVQIPTDRPLGHAGPSPLTAPTPEQDFAPIPDRWRLGFPDIRRYFDRPGEIPYLRGHPKNPYRQNVLKGDYPLFGQDYFVNLTLASEMLMDARRLPTPSAVSGARAGNIPFFGKGEQAAYSQTLRFGFDLYKGNPAYRPRDWFFRAVPVVNFNYVATRENNVVDVDVRRGQTRFDTHFSVDDLFVEKRLMRLSPYYDFASLRAGVQGFNADFRGFLFVDNEPGVRLFGNDKANRYQFNLALFPMLEKDTNSGLNRLFRTRRQTVALLNLYRQDFLRNGFDSAFTIAHNRDRPAIVYDDNGFLVRPTPIGFVVPVQGIPRPQSLRVWYLGWAGNGHIDRWNISHALYWVMGKDDFNPIAGKRIDVNAYLLAAEVSYDRDWRRYRASFVFASGDGDPTDNDGHGFDTIVDNPNFVGGPFSFWVSQGLRLAGTSVGLVHPFSFLPNLRSSKLQGHANFVNPGLLLFNLGMDIDYTPRTRFFVNANYYRFHRVQPLELVLFQAPIRHDIGYEVNFGVRYRPQLNDNIVFVGGIAAFFPGGGFRDIYERRKVLFSLFGGFTLAY
jgi:hypothetical protein